MTRMNRRCGRLCRRRRRRAAENASFALLARFTILLKLVLDAIKERIHLAVNLNEGLIWGWYSNGLQFFLRPGRTEHRGGQGSGSGHGTSFKAEDPAPGRIQRQESPSEWTGMG